MAEFVHLHVHTEYSLLDGAARIGELIAAARKYSMPALAITDHGSMYGVVEFYKQCRQAGIKPVLGCEVYVAPRSRFDKSGREQDNGYHLTLLAKNNTGYANLTSLVSAGYTEGFYYRPRVDKELLKIYSEGLIALSGCMGGEIPTSIAAGNIARAKEIACQYRDIFGAGNFWLELQNHGIPGQRQINAGLLEIARTTGIGMVVTNDVHYVTKKAAEVHDILLCVQTGKKLTDNDRMKFESDELWFKPYDEILTQFPEKEFRDALGNTAVIAAACNVEIEFGRMLLPDYPLPAGITPEQHLRTLCAEGLEVRYPSGHLLRGPAAKRMEQELETICSMGFTGYFLIVWDFINYARRKGIAIGPGRGSAAGSVVSYLLAITDIDPVKHGLLFERFLNPERVTMPDIDTDICYARRTEVVDYIYNKYGAQNVGQVGTFGTLGAKQSIKDVGRVLDYSYSDIDRICKQITSRPGITIREALEESAELRKMHDGEEVAKRVINLALQIEGMPRHVSVHAAGVVIANDELSRHVPVQLTPDGDVVTQYDKDIIEEIGLLKMDLLGLRNLTIIDDAVKLIAAECGNGFSTAMIPEEDAATAEMLCRGDTDCIFQLESAGMTQLVKDYQPGSYTDIIPILALYRPATIKAGMVSEFVRRRRGEIEIEYLHPSLKPILDDTFGIMLYQEQVMQIANVMAGFSLGQADILRRAMGKKKPEVLAAQRQNFVRGALKNGYTPELAEYVFELIDKFSGYGFNKSHSAAYALISWQTAYLKKHYPLFYMAALLSSVMNDSAHAGYYMEICRKMGIRVLQPDLNCSDGNFSVENGAVRAGLNVVKNVGTAAIGAILSEREKNGRYKSLRDLLRRIELRSVNRKTLESLAYSGAMDGFGLKRSQLIALVNPELEYAQLQAKERCSGQLSLFGGNELDLSDQPPAIEEYDKLHLLEMEKETVGYYFSGHPLDEYRKKFVALQKIAVVSSDETGEHAEITVGGIIKEVKRLTTRKGDLMAVIRLEDYSGDIEVVFFPQAYEIFRGHLEKDERIVVCGKVSRSNDEQKIIAEQCADLRYYNALLKVRTDGSAAMYDMVRAIMRRQRGCTKVYIYPGAQRMQKLAMSEWVSVSPQLIMELEKVLGPENIKVE